MPMMGKQPALNTWRRAFLNPSFVPRRWKMGRLSVFSNPASNTATVILATEAESVQPIGVEPLKWC